MGTKPLLGKTNANFQGSLALTSLADLVQFFGNSNKSGELSVTHHQEGQHGQIYFVDGEMVHASCPKHHGIDALAELLGWTDGNFEFSPESITPRSTIALPAMHAIMEAARLRDEQISRQVNDSRSSKNKTKLVGRSNEEMLQTLRESSDVLEDLLKIPSVDAVIVIGRDGFVIESSGNSNRIDVDGLGAALAHAINAIEEMGAELQVDRFQDIFVEYGRAVILSRPVGEAVVALVMPDALKLGIVRHKAGGLLQELGRHF